MRTHSTWTLGRTTAGRVMWLLTALVFLFSSAVRAADVSVNCDSGGSINSALSGLDLEGPNSITVTGTCHESVAIVDRERLTIQAPRGQTATIVSDPLDIAIFVFRSRSIFLRRLVLTGGSEGMAIQRSEVQINGSTIQNNSDVGVDVFQLSSLQFAGNVVQNNGDGIIVSQNSRLGAGGGDVTIQNNVGSGIVLANGAFANIFGHTIQNNGGFGVIAFHNSSFNLFGNTIVGNGSTGVRVSETSHGEMGDNTIRNNGAADPSSPGGVMLSEGGEAFIDGGNDISNNTGPGVLVFTHATLSSEGGNTINNNTAEGVLLRRQSVGQFFAADTISGNGGANLACDATSLAAGTLTGLTNFRCMNIERQLGPPRPGHIKNLPSPPGS